MSQLFLASASPRRAQILETAGIPFTVVSSAAVEPPPSAEDDAHPARYADRLAQLKAAGCDLDQNRALHKLPDTVKILVLAADTIVWHDGKILSKPKDAADAVKMLQRLRGQTHTVFTGVCLRVDAEYSVEHEATQVTFGPASDSWIENYVATGEPMDKAGSYAAQGRGALLVERIEGDFWNVVGLPLVRVARMIEKQGLTIE